MPGGRKFASKDSAPSQRRKMTESEKKKRELKKAKISQEAKKNLFKLMERDTPNTRNTSNDTTNTVTQQPTASSTSSLNSTTEN